MENSIDHLNNWGTSCGKDESSLQKWLDVDILFHWISRWWHEKKSQMITKTSGVYPLGSDRIISVMEIHLLRAMNVNMKCRGNANTNLDISVNTMPTSWGRHRKRNWFTKENQTTTFQHNAFNNCWVIFHRKKTATSWWHCGTSDRITKVVKFIFWGSWMLVWNIMTIHTITVEIFNLTQCQLHSGTKGTVRGTPK